jgi:sn-glycerol 3-phosphate transport system permease protein
MHHRTAMTSVYGWLLLMPAAIFLVAFTYYPTDCDLGEKLFFARYGLAAI